MRHALTTLDITGFKSFGKKTALIFSASITGIVGPNGSGKSNVAEAFRFVLGEQSMKSMRGKRGEDMIWGGSTALSRQNRASVLVRFDNTPEGGKRLLDIDFDEVVVERVVHRDGANEYLINGTQVRLKDVIRLLAGANIGGSGYQIISQGEADRILSASPRERREMVEDALGLKLYQHKKAESERKLEETALNIEKTKSLRRELAPHLVFLRREVEKHEKARDTRELFAATLREYLAREHAYLTAEDARLRAEEEPLRAEVKQLAELLAAAKKASPQGGEEATKASEHYAALASREGALREVRAALSDLVRELGRAEGALEANTVQVEQLVAVPAVRSFAREIDEALAAALALSREEISAALVRVRERIRSFVEGITTSAPITHHEAEARVASLTASVRQKEEEERNIVVAIEVLRKEIAALREKAFTAERETIELEGALRARESAQKTLEVSRVRMREERARFEEEVREGIALVGEALRGWEGTEIPEGALTEERHEQEKRRRTMERLKIKIEEAGLGNSEAILREFTETRDRDAFLARELQDLETSKESLRGIIKGLEETIDERFSEGLKAINSALDNFFTKLFGGGSAKLFIEKSRPKEERLDEDEEEESAPVPEEEPTAGLVIDVALPRKKIRGLEVLSGGERALTSIALIFSMTQVNPPPFLILDETDAALDEANSKRYADMIRELGQKSQLIVITHNRATMAAAGELYGVTMAQDGVSKLLSVRLEEAERVAK